MAEGSSNSGAGEWLWLIGFFGFLALSTIAAQTPPDQRVGDEAGPLVNNTVSYSGTAPVALANNDQGASVWEGQVQVSWGNAKSESNPRREYLVLEAPRSNDASVIINGWILENGRGNKLSVSGRKEVWRASERVSLPMMVLSPGDRAVVTSGQAPHGSLRGSLSAFKVNKCSGYLEEYYNFTPPLKTNCPYPEETVLGGALSDKCYDFIKEVPRCVDPEFSYKGDDRTTLRRLPEICRNFIESQLNYNGCVAAHQNDSDFYNSDSYFRGGGEWRVFLNWPHELWDDQRETITLYDSAARVVDKLEY